jgi:class 3 adenylate cyclase
VQGRTGTVNLAHTTGTGTSCGRRSVPLIDLARAVQRGQSVRVAHQDDAGSWVRRGEVRYARVHGEHLAYRVIAGAGRRDVVLLMSGTASMDSLFEDPVALRLLEGLAGLGRLVVFDRRGIGLSDPPADTSAAVTSRWLEDLEAVVTAAELVCPVLVSARSSAPLAILYADRHPEGVASIVMHEPGARFDAEVIRAQLAGEIDSVALWCPSRADEPGFREWFVRAGQVGASPRMAERAYAGMNNEEVREIEEAAARLRLPTLVLRRPAHRLSPPRDSDPIMALVPGAQRVDIPGQDLMIFGGEVDALVAEVHHFVTGEHRLPAPERVLAAVLYTDLVASTERATALGDAHWKRLLDIHDDVARSCIAHRGGIVIKTTGDGIVATLPSATSSLLAAQELRAVLVEHRLGARIGIHVGDVQHRGEDITGAAVVIAARIMELAGSGEILASNIAVGAATGSSMQFESRGVHELKGIHGTWQVFALTTPTLTHTHT